MLENADKYPAWLIEQRGKQYRAANHTGVYFRRSTLIINFAEHLKEQGRPITLEAIRAMLQFVERGYSLHTDQISRALAGMYKNNTIPKMPNGRPVTIDGEQYPSARSAAEAYGISPQTVLNRIGNDRPKWAGWTWQTVPGAVPNSC